MELLDDAHGGIEISVSSSAVTVERVEVTITAPDIATITETLDFDGTTATGVILGIPVGDNRLVSLDAFEMGNTTAVCRGSEMVPMITPDAVEDVMIVLQCDGGGETGGVDINGTLNDPPTIQSVFFTDVNPSVGAMLIGRVTASDADSPGPLTYNWSAATGSCQNFGTPGAAETTWTAPAAPRTCDLSIRVQDSEGGISELSFDVVVGP